MDKEKVKELAMSQGFDIVAIADPANVDLSDKHKEAKSIILLGFATPDKMVDTYYDDDKKFSKWIYDTIETRAWRICNVLRDAGYSAVPTKRLDLKRAGVVTGIGSIGKNNLLLTKEFGPRIRFIAIASDFELEFDAATEDYLCTECYDCWEACPGKTFSENGFDRSKCIGEFDPTPEMLEKQIAHRTRFGPHTVSQCTECMFSCPVGK